MQGSTAILEADRCVSCGLCLPSCPTYRKTLSEADSPRGRIALMRGVMKEEIPLNARFTWHIDLCLDCRACERACPNHVAYGAILRAMRRPIESARKKSFWRRSLEKAALGLVAHPARLETIGWALDAIPKLIRSKLGHLLPQIVHPLPDSPVYPARGAVIGEVGLFLGCVARITDALTLNAAIHVLTRLGYTVHVPQSQTCCGALHARFGEEASKLKERNALAFAGLDTIVGTSSACSAELSGRIVDINRFLMEAQGWETIEISPLDEKIAVHVPCSLRNVLKGEAYPFRLLEKIPGVQVVPLGGNDQCCGSAGSYFLTQPEMANALLGDKMNMVAESGTGCVATSNVGCAMSLRGAGVKVLHPVVILAYQMGFK
ncbi:MAG: (Fe-S)-binding protein [Burkholderiales bacterium]|nr:(Fe-S)-binding protein [Burkholderiales bacterium]